MKLTVIGCGASSTPAIVGEIAGGRTGLVVAELALVDPDRRAVQTLGKQAQRILDEAGSSTALRTTTELEQGADGADAVILRLDAGGPAARRSDLTFPPAHGCLGHHTVGAGGIARALRTVPLALDIADRVRKVAGEQAWLVNATGPVGMVTRALLHARHRAVGIGGDGAEFAPWVAKVLGVPADVVSVQHLGAPQVNWARAVTITGPNAMMDVLPALLAEQADVLGDELGLPGALLRRTGTVPGYWLKYFYRPTETVAEQQDSTATHADDEEPGAAADGVRAVELVAALAGREPVEHQVTARNSGLLPFLAQDAVVEAPALVDSTGVRTLPALPLPPAMAGLIAQVTAAEALAVEAAREGSREAVADALLAHPLIGTYDLAEKLTDALLAENADFLPWAKN